MVNRILKEEITELIENGKKIYKYSVTMEHTKNGEEIKKIFSETSSKYQEWYTVAVHTVKLLIPERYAEFRLMYSNEENRNKMDAHNYYISDYLMGRTIHNFFGQEIFKSHHVFLHLFKRQIDIISSLPALLDFRVVELEKIIRHEIFETELETAEELLKKGYVRASGMIAGVVFEKNLKEICTQYNLSFTKKHVSITECIERLTSEGIIDTPTMRQFKLFGDIRNYCAHSKEREPKKEEVNNLLEGCRKICSSNRDF